jgi:GxxExxY protein
MGPRAVELEHVDDPATGAVIGAAIAVHRVLGPGLLESAYQACLAHELLKRGHAVRREVALPVEYDGVRLDCGYRVDLIVDDQVVVEVKCVEGVKDIHLAQLITYLRLSGITRGLVINFNEQLLRDGVFRRVLTHKPSPPSSPSVSPPASSPPASPSLPSSALSAPLR